MVGVGGVVMALMAGGTAAVVGGALAAAAGAAWLAGMVVGGFDAALGGGAGQLVGGLLGDAGMAAVDTINAGVSILGLAGGIAAGVGAIRGKLAGRAARGMGTKNTGSAIEVAPEESPRIGGRRPYDISRRGIEYIQEKTGLKEIFRNFDNPPLSGRMPDFIDERLNIWHESKNTSDKVSWTKQLRETADLARREGYEYHVWVRMNHARSTLLAAEARGEIYLHYFPW